MVDGQPKVSVIIPVYNAEKHVRECLNSVCSQTLSSYEVICIDDCSTDGSLFILQEYQKKYDFIKIVRQSCNLGSGSSRNLGLKIATGEYVAFMDADDSYPDEYTLNIMYQAAVKKKALVCGGGVLFIKDGVLSKGKLGDDNYTFDKCGWVSYYEYQQLYYYQRFIYNREMLENNNISFPNYLRFQDPPFFIKSMVSAKRFYAIQRATYVYRNDATHVNWTEKKVNDMLCGYCEVLQLCREYHLDKIYYSTLYNCLNNRYFLNIVENSLVSGNDEILRFYQTLVHEIDLKLLGEKNASKLDLAYAEIMANAKLQRNIQYRYNEQLIYSTEKSGTTFPLVSVIVPVYNVEPYLAMCLDSLLGQSLDNIEIICINDGSTDNSASILDKYEKCTVSQKSIRVYHQENRGLSAARNAGLAHAQGRYVYFMDSDDYLSHVALETLYELAERDRLDVVYFSGKSFFENQIEANNPANRYFSDAYQRKDIYPDVLSGKQMFVKQHKNQDYYTLVQLQFYRKEFLQENCLCFFEGLLHEDNLFTLNAILKAARTRCVSMIGFYRRIRAGSIMTSGLTYRNLLGYYMTAVEASKHMSDIDLQMDEKEVLYQKLTAFVENHVCYKWLDLKPADKALFLASLTTNDRLLFQTMCMPAIHFLEKMKKNSIAPKKKNQPTASTNKTVTEPKGTGKWIKKLGRKLVPKRLKPFVKRQLLRIPHKQKVKIKKMIHW